MAVATTQTQKADKSTQGRIALWRARPDSAATFTGKISVTPSMLRRLLENQPDEYGQIHMDVLGFRNDAQGSNAPAYTGYARLQENRPEAPVIERSDEF